MDNKIKPIKYSENLCFKCLKEHNHINTYMISNRGYGSSFDECSSKLQLCDECNNNDLEIWFNEQPKYVGFTENYKYEDDIHSFVKELPIQGRELFENALMGGAFSYVIDSQDWIDIELDIAQDEVYKRNSMYSPSEIKAYHERFPSCKQVYLKIFSDGSSCCKCEFDAHGKSDGSCDEHNISSECYTCKNYEKKNIDSKLNEIKDFKLSKSDINIVTMFEWTCPKCGKINHTYSYEDCDYCTKCDTYVDFELEE